MSRSNLYVLFLFTLLVSQIFEITRSQSRTEFCHSYDKKILLNIKNELGNPPSLASWDPNTDCVNWKDILCNNEQGHVTYVGIMDAPDIHSPFPTSLNQLNWLTDIYFMNVPNLSGPLPSYLSSLTNLTTFTVSGTKLTGQIPSFLGGLTNLRQLDLSYNKLTGQIPNFFGRLKSLIFLDLSNNGLTSPLPTGLTQLVSLIDLQLGSNKLSGPIPGFLAQLKNLNTIDLSSNSITGQIPDYFGHMPTLTALTLSNNLLTGPIPKSLSRSNLMTIYLSHNRFTGDASFLFDKANTKIVDIHIDYNFFKFDFSNVDLSRTLVAFNVSHNMIYGSLPKRFGQMIITSVDVSFNQLCGPIPNGRRFKRVDPAIFSHNKCICGGPLRACK